MQFINCAQEEGLASSYLEIHISYRQVPLDFKRNNNTYRILTRGQKMTITSVLLMQTKNYEQSKNQFFTHVGREAPAIMAV